MIRPDQEPEEYHETLSAGDEIDSLAIALGIVAAIFGFLALGVVIQLARITVTY